jgi:hypothetical protein
MQGKICLPGRMGASRPLGLLPSGPQGSGFWEPLSIFLLNPACISQQQGAGYNREKNYAYKASRPPGHKGIYASKASRSPKPPGLQGLQASKGSRPPRPPDLQGLQGTQASKASNHTAKNHTAHYQHCRKNGTLHTAKKLYWIYCRKTKGANRNRVN